MTGSLALAVARMHGHLVTRPGSDVFHVYSGRLTPSSRWVPRAGRVVCSAKTRRLSVLERVGSVLDLGGRRMCGRCAARLTSLSVRAAQPVSRDERIVFWSGLPLRDLVTAIALAATVDESHAVGYVLALLFPAPPPRRPALLTQGQALFDVHAELHRRRRQLRHAEMTPEEREAAALAREDEDDDRRRVDEARRRAAAMDKAVDRKRRGQYLTPWEKSLVDSA